VTSEPAGGLIAGEGDELGDVDALVAHALDVLHHVQEGRHDAQIAGDGGLEGEQGEDPLVDLEIAPVDAIVVGDHHLGELDILVLERLEHAVELLDDKVEPAERALLELAQLQLEVLARGGLGDSRCAGITAGFASRTFR
jgi:hypothetical protein